MTLARVFQDYMTLQRRQPILIWGSSDKRNTVEVRLNGEKIYDARIEEGDFSFLIPAQEAMEDAVLEIGDMKFTHVDIGEVWVAGGQSNMEFMLRIRIRERLRLQQQMIFTFEPMWWGSIRLPENEKRGIKRGIHGRDGLLLSRNMQPSFRQQLFILQRNCVNMAFRLEF